MVLYAVAQASRLKRENVCESKQMSGPEQAAVLEAHQTGCWFSCPSVSCKQIQMDNFTKRETEKRKRKKEQQQAQD